MENKHMIHITSRLSKKKKLFFLEYFLLSKFFEKITINWEKSTDLLVDSNLNNGQQNERNKKKVVTNKKQRILQSPFVSGFTVLGPLNFCMLTEIIFGQSVNRTHRYVTQDNLLSDNCFKKL